MKFLNLGCGNCFIPEWTNIDFISNSEYVKAYDLRNKFPLESNTYDLVYHSHVLEHFSKTDGIFFLKECFRVLKPEGIIRIAVPNMERIAQEYLNQINLSVSNFEVPNPNYEWIILELLDQMVRNKSGGEMLSYLESDKIENEDYVYYRLGKEAIEYRKYLLNRKFHNTVRSEISLISKTYSKIKSIKKNILISIVKHILKDDDFETKYKIGKFRLEGEIHQWMYDRYSLTKLLYSLGFNNVEIHLASSSNILDWAKLPLDLLPDGTTRKPDSLFIEARK